MFLIYYYSYNKQLLVSQNVICCLVSLLFLFLLLSFHHHLSATVPLSVQRSPFLSSPSLFSSSRHHKLHLSCSLLMSPLLSLTLLLPPFPSSSPFHISNSTPVSCLPAPMSHLNLPVMPLARPSPLSPTLQPPELRQVSVTDVRLQHVFTSY